VQPSRKVGCVAACDIPNLLFRTSNIKPQKCKKTEAKKKLTELLKLCDEKTTIMADFTAEEVQNALKSVENGKSVGTDGGLPEFLKNLWPRSIR